MSLFSFPAKDASATFSDLRHSHVCLRVPDYEAAKEWFTGVLDFRVVHEWPEPMLNVQMGYFAAADDDSAVIEIVGGNHPAPAPRASADFVGSFGFEGVHHMCFRVPSVDATIEKLTSRGVTIVAEPFEVEAIGRRIAFFADPWGNLFELEQVLT